MISDLFTAFASFVDTNLSPTKPIQVSVSRNDKPVEWLNGNVFDGIQDNEDFSGYISFDETVKTRVVNPDESDSSCQNSYERSLNFKLIIYGFKIDRFRLEQRLSEIIDSFVYTSVHESNIDIIVNEIELNPQKIYMEENQTDSPPRDGFTIVRVSCELTYQWNYNSCATDLGCRC